MKPARAAAGTCAALTLASKRSEEASLQPYWGGRDPAVETTLQHLTAPSPSMARAITELPRRVSPGWSEAPSGFSPGLNRRSNVSRVTWSLPPDELAVFDIEACALATEQS